MSRARRSHVDRGRQDAQSEPGDGPSSDSCQHHPRRDPSRGYSLRASTFDAPTPSAARDVGGVVGRAKGPGGRHIAQSSLPVNRRSVEHDGTIPGVGIGVELIHFRFDHAMGDGVHGDAVPRVISRHGPAEAMTPALAAAKFAELRKPKMPNTEVMLMKRAHGSSA